MLRNRQNNKAIAPDQTMLKGLLNDPITFSVEIQSKLQCFYVSISKRKIAGSVLLVNFSGLLIVLQKHALEK